MAKTKFFTEQVTGGSRGEASAEDLERGYSEADVGAGEMPDDGMFWAITDEGGGGFLGRAKGWER